MTSKHNHKNDTAGATPSPTTTTAGASPAPAPAAGVPQMDVSKLAADRAVAKLIEYAVSAGASDLFLASDDQQVTVSVRRLGVVQRLSALPPEQGRRLLSHVRVHADIDLSEKRRPLDGHWIYRQEDGPTVDVRVNAMPTLHGEDLALRLLVRDSQLFSVDNIGLEPEQHAQLSAMLESPSGLVLITGPTGSGKTATLYACLRELNDGRRKINTIEDPVEYAVEGLRQSQVNGAIDLGFVDLLRGVLRQSPDVIMIGEIRDPETADIAVRAANSGHLVLSTVHAPGAAAAVQSMRALGVHPHFLSTALRGVVSQRLLRTLCAGCRASFDLSASPETFADLRPWLAPGEGKALWAPGACDLCERQGYAGRTGVFEVMPVTTGLRDLIAAGRPTRDLNRRAAEDGMLEFRHAAMLKVARGVTSAEEVARVVPPEQLAAEPSEPWGEVVHRTRRGSDSFDTNFTPSRREIPVGPVRQAS